jgi:hypothetical protein
MDQPTGKHYGMCMMTHRRYVCKDGTYYWDTGQVGGYPFTILEYSSCEDDYSEWSDEKRVSVFTDFKDRCEQAKAARDGRTARLTEIADAAKAKLTDEELAALLEIYGD